MRHSPSLEATTLLSSGRSKVVEVQECACVYTRHLTLLFLNVWSMIAVSQRFFTI